MVDRRACVFPEGRLPLARHGLEVVGRVWPRQRALDETLTLERQPEQAGEEALRPGFVDWGVSAGVTREVWERTGLLRDKSGQAFVSEQFRRYVGWGGSTPPIHAARP